jgi:hypothetical protein
LSPGHLLAAFVIKQHNIDFCLDLTNGDLSNSNQLQIWTCNKGNNNQIWLDGPPGGSTPPPPPPPPAGRPLHHNGDTSKCVDVKGAVFANGTPVEMWVFLSLGAPLRLTFYEALIVMVVTHRTGFSIMVTPKSKWLERTSALTLLPVVSVGFEKLFDNDFVTNFALLHARPGWRYQNENLGMLRQSSCSELVLLQHSHSQTPIR